MKNKAEKIKSISIIILMLIVFTGLVILGCKTIHEHYANGVYDGDSWNRVWPIMVSTVIVIFSTLITSYVFLKDTLDRLADEKPYYAEVIKKYRKEKVCRLMWFSIMLVGVSCYLLICQTAMDDNAEMPFYIYVGVLAVVVLMICSLIFLCSCINIENSLDTCTKNILKNLGIEIEEEWNKLKGQWNEFIDDYAGANIRDKMEFLEVLENDEDQAF
ncbi:MAG: hypothetical protein LUE14_09785 [Clostridiales bacterium]|nr:hypothetical protein [Clostridiales bacterium]